MVLALFGRTHLNLSDMALEFAKVDSFLEPETDKVRQLQKSQSSGLILSDLHFINLGRCTASHFGKNKPSDNYCNGTGSCEAVLQRTSVKLQVPCNIQLNDLQETSFDTPARHGLVVNHKRGAEAEHNGDYVGRSKCPTSCLCTQTLLGNFGRVGVTNGRGTSC